MRASETGAQSTVWATPSASDAAPESAIPDAAAVVVAESVGVAEAAQPVGLDGAQPPPSGARIAELQLDRKPSRRTPRSHSPDPATEQDRLAADLRG